MVIAAAPTRTAAAFRILVIEFSFVMVMRTETMLPRTAFGWCEEGSAPFESRKNSGCSNALKRSSP
jgi:hypothetical protein